MSNPNLQLSVLDPRYWQLDRDDRDATIQYYIATPAEEVTPMRSLEAAVMAWQDVERLALAVEKLAGVVAQIATERQPQPSVPPRRRGRPPNALTVRAHPERRYMTVLGKRMTYEQAQHLGSLIFQALNETEGTQDE
jgi:hypothetical protein